jgi:WD40 repeat protein
MADASNQSVLAHDTTPLRLAHTLSAETPVYSLAFDSTGGLLASGGDNLVQVWDVSTGDLSAIWKTDRRVRSLAFEPNGILASGAEGEVRLLESGHRRVPSSYPRPGRDGLFTGFSSFQGDRRCRHCRRPGQGF